MPALFPAAAMSAAGILLGHSLATRRAAEVDPKPTFLRSRSDARVGWDAEAHIRDSRTRLSQSHTSSSSSAFASFRSAVSKPSVNL